MSSIYEKNLRVLQLFHPELAQAVHASQTTELFDLKASKSGSPALTQNVNGQTVYLHDPMDPIAQANQVLKDAEVNHPKMVIFLGFGLGYQVYAFLQNLPESVEAIWIVEKDLAAFKLALTAYPMEKLFENPRCHFYIGKTPEEFRNLFFHFMMPHERLYYVKAIDIVPFRPILSIPENGQYYESVMHFLQEGMQFRHEVATAHPDDSFVGFKQLLQNAESVFNSANIDQLKDACHGLPGVCVGSGPSLDLSKRFLEKLDERAVTVFVSSVARKLTNEGYQAHFICNCERDWQPAELVHDLKLTRQTHLVVPPLVHPNNFKYFENHIVTIMRQVNLFEWFPSPYQSHYIGSHSGLVGLYLLMWMGCDPIILLGHDLAFSRFSKESHAVGMHQNGVTEDYKEMVMNMQHIEVIGNDGKPIATTHDWINVARRYGLFLREQSATCINAIPKEYGAPIVGAKQMEPKEAFAQHIGYQRREIDERIEPVLQPPTEEEQYKQRQMFKSRVEITKSGLIMLFQEVKNLLSQVNEESCDIDKIYCAYQKILYEQQPANILLFDIINSLDLDLMTTYHEIPRKIVSPLLIKEKRQVLLKEALQNLLDWGEKIYTELSKV